MILLTGCFEIIEEITLKDNGSGTLSYTINMSQSKTKLNSIMMLDSLNGQKIPSENDITRKMNEVLTTISSIEGISAVQKEVDFSNYIFKFSCNFSDVKALESATIAVKNTYGIEDPYAQSDNHFNYDIGTKTFRRKGDYKGEADLSQIKSEDLSMLKEATLTAIYRFDSEIKFGSHPKLKISPNKKAAMVRENVVDLMTKKSSVENTIRLK